MARVPLLLLALVLLDGCAAGMPARRDYGLGPWRTSYRDWSGAGAKVCEAEATWMFEELTEVNTFLDKFLASSAARGGSWSDDELPILEEAGRTLGPLLDAHQANLRLVRACPFAAAGVFPEVVQKGEALAEDARKELATASQLVSFGKAQRSVEQRQRERDEAEGEAKRACETASTPGGVIYFAEEDQLGLRRWHFCDGVQVHSTQQGKLELTPPTTPEQELVYLRAVHGYAERSIRRSSP